MESFSSAHDMRCKGDGSGFFFVAFGYEMFLKLRGNGEDTTRVMESMCDIVNAIQGALYRGQRRRE